MNSLPSAVIRWPSEPGHGGKFVGGDVASDDDDVVVVVDLVGDSNAEELELDTVESTRWIKMVPTPLFSKVPSSSFK